MKILKRKTVFALLALALAVVIFWFSYQRASISWSQSNGFIYFFLSRFLSDGISPGLSHFVRKSAHFCMYALLGGLVCGSVMKKKAYFRTFCVSEIFCVFYAVTDEIHQYFVPGRACCLSDVAIDSLGAVYGIAFALFVFYLIEKQNKTPTK